MSNDSSKRVFWWLLDGVLLVLILTGLFSVKVLRANEASRLPVRTITVSADGEAVAIPDIARLSFSVVSEGLNPKTLQDENTKKANELVEFAKSQGVEKKDIKTSQYNLSPRYDYDKITGRSKIYGYSVTQTVSIKIRDFEKIGPILEGLPGRGANEISSLFFEVDEPDTYLDTAREEAFMKARKKAEAMARQNGVSIGKILTFSEGGGYPPVFPLYEKFGRGGVAEDTAGPVPQIEPGSQEITVQVTVTYELR